jgi:hypothetical protein
MVKYNACLVVDLKKFPFLAVLGSDGTTSQLLNMKAVSTF